MLIVANGAWSLMSSRVCFWGPHDDARYCTLALPFLGLLLDTE